MTSSYLKETRDKRGLYHNPRRLVCIFWILLHWESSLKGKDDSGVIGNYIQSMMYGQSQEPKSRQSQSLFYWVNIRKGAILFTLCSWLCYINENTKMPLNKTEWKKMNHVAIRNIALPNNSFANGLHMKYRLGPFLL